MRKNFDYQFRVTDVQIAGALSDPRFQNLKEVDLALKDHCTTNSQFWSGFVAKKNGRSHTFPCRETFTRWPI